MNFFNHAIMRRLFAPGHELSCSWFLWRRLKIKLRERGHCCRRESGAFLLGHRDGGSARIVDFVLYDDSRSARARQRHRAVRWALFQRPLGDL